MGNNSVENHFYEKLNKGLFRSLLKECYSPTSKLYCLLPAIIIKSQDLSHLGLIWANWVPNLPSPQQIESKKRQTPDFDFKAWWQHKSEVKQHKNFHGAEVMVTRHWGCRSGQKLNLRKIAMWMSKNCQKYSIDNFLEKWHFLSIVIGNCFFFL